MTDGTVQIGLRRPMRSLGIAASGLSAQRARLDAIAMNIANAETTRGVDGGPYRRRTVSLQEVAFAPTLAGAKGAGLQQGGGVRVDAMVEDQSAGQFSYDPGHPDADENGYVLMPNVNITAELTDMMQASRLFEANATVFNAIKSVLRRAAQL